MSFVQYGAEGLLESHPDTWADHRMLWGPDIISKVVADLTKRVDGFSPEFIGYSEL